MHFTNDFLSHDDLYTVALIALLLVLVNLWDWMRYGYEHGKEVHLAGHPLQDVSRLAAKAFAAARFPHAVRTAPRALMQRRAFPLAPRVGHRPLKPAA